MTNKKFFATVQTQNNLNTRIKSFVEYYKDMMNIIPNPNKLIQQNGYSVLIDTYADSTVRAAVNIIYEGISSLEFDIIKNGASDKEVELAYATVEKLIKNNLVKQILKAIFFGFNPLNIVWQKSNNHLIIDKIFELPHESIIIDNDLKIKVLTHNNMMNGDEIEDYRLLLPVYDYNSQNPYGTGLLLHCFKHIFIKNNILTFWTSFAEDFGFPGVLGVFERQAATSFQMSPEDFVEYFYKQLLNMRQNKVLVTPEGTNIQNIPAGNISSSDIYSNLIEYCKNEINNIILGHEASTKSTPGKLGNENMAMSMKIDRIESFTSFLTLQINELLKWQHDLNFTGDTHCKIRFFEKDDIEKYTHKAVLAKELSAIGVKFNDDYIETEFNIDKKFFKLEQINSELKTSKPISKVTNHNSTDNKYYLLKNNYHDSIKIKNQKDNDVIDKFIKYVLETDEFKELTQDTIDTITKELSKYDDFKSMQKNVFKIFDKINIDNKKEFIKKFLLISAIYGYNSEAKNG